MSLADEMRSLAKELGEVAVAVSVVGTTHAKLGELARRAADLANEMRGDRPEVKKLRTEILQRVHDLKVSPPNQRSARVLRALQHTIDIAKNRVRSGLGQAPETFELNVPGDFADFTVGNTWGYTEGEAESALRAARKALVRLAEIGLNPKPGLTIVLDPEWADGWSAIYDRDWETLVMDPEGRGTEGSGNEGQARQVAHALGIRIWHEVFKADDREAWPSYGAFALAFATFLMGEKVTPDDAARLVVTAGKHAKKWPAKVATR